MKPVIIFGAGEFSEVAHFYLTRDAGRRVTAFTVDRSHLSSAVFCGLPVVAFEDVQTVYPPSDFEILIAVGYTKVNDFRAEKCSEARRRGYTLITYVHSKAVVAANVTPGDNAFILENNVVQPFVTIGSNVVLWSGNHIGHHSSIGDNCFISSHVVISGGTKIGRNCFIGVNATIRDHVTVADRCVIGAGAVIKHDTQPGEVFKGHADAAADITSDQLKNF